MNTTETGKKAEAAAADHLRQQGYRILAQNWRTRWCEIDVVAQKEGAIYFAEVKYRQTARQGDGLDYITPKKMEQMTFAAELWVASKRWDGEYCLLAVAVSGPDYIVDAVIEL